MKLKVRKLQESDWKFIPEWYKQYDQIPPPREFLPGRFEVGKMEDTSTCGLGGFIVCKGEDPIAAIWLYMTNSKTAIPALVISDKTYRDVDRDEALQMLVNFTTDFAWGMGYQYSFTWASKGVLFEKYEEAGFKGDDSPTHEMVLNYKNKENFKTQSQWEHK